jgi:hypothetical protein
VVPAPIEKKPAPQTKITPAPGIFCSLTVTLVWNRNIPLGKNC